jgi:hypothetical protein
MVRANEEIGPYWVYSGFSYFPLYWNGNTTEKNTWNRLRRFWRHSFQLGPG